MAATTTRMADKATPETSDPVGVMRTVAATGEAHDVEPATATAPAVVRFSIVVAMTASRAIGQRGQLPWGRLPKEMAAFRDLTRTTTDPARTNALIMGRVTFDSLPRRRPLPGRLHVVLTRRPPGTDTYPEDVLTAASLDEALALVGHAEKVFVIGGAQVYADAVAHPACAGVWLTQIASPDYPDADAFFPSLSDEVYGPAEALDEFQRECGVTYRRLYRPRLASAVGS
ncbi:Dihydrofolate reductase [Pandoravirus salinus]|uniref:dihydrofolate reductase n=1 Tax=Pandoravirus salinus TaxID=1349410 RepID=S4VUT3_9VIRU|nr:Dihydrofolate reductase [Pandoravirus salinus]AGO84113.2 Dihydrofolate reductase [Pandoravirus salinus]